MYSVRLAGTEKNYRVGKIVCLARNYSEHIKELGNEVPDKPVLFIKPSSSIIGHRESVVIPSYSGDCHHEVELAVLIGKWGKNISEQKALSHVAGYGVAIDMTLRDVQNTLKEKGLPWEVAKGFDTACPLSEFISADQVPDPHDLHISLQVNGETRQDSSTACMMRRIPAIIRDVSEIFTLEEGDIILTGTPAGVGPVVCGDKMRAEIEKVGSLEVAVQ
ncbi:MAG: acylpyruvase [Desulfuromonas sp.]|uniref:fumarylacetoacetate hydrolase family protein n=1 Tax=Desulfuromonas sp. TaxID=892 RepID=UPI000CA74F30|nr:fumarylacetoacetate hydrolase family protein [Desulfuromonas sp.]PLX86328.1 MAG: acylpyruvase [Desulfuromonas sp.]